MYKTINKKLQKHAQLYDHFTVRGGGGSYIKKRFVFKIKYWVAFVNVVFVGSKISSSILTPFKIRSSFFFFDKFLKNGT